MPSGDDEHWRRSLRIDVVEREHRFVLVDDRAGNLAGDDAAEQAGRMVFGHWSFASVIGPGHWSWSLVPNGSVGQTRAMMAVRGMPCKSRLSSITCNRLV